MRRNLIVVALLACACTDTTAPNEERAPAGRYTITAIFPNAGAYASGLLEIEQVHARAFSGSVTQLTPITHVGDPTPRVTDLNGAEVSGSAVYRRQFDFSVATLGEDDEWEFYGVVAGDSVSGVTRLRRGDVVWMGTFRMSRGWQ